MKKILLLPFILLSVLMLSACGNSDTSNTNSEGSNKQKTITYESETGPIEVPANPERVVVLAGSYVGNVLALDVNLVGVDVWSKMNPRFEAALDGVEEVSDENLEKIIELDPDLIIGASNTKNIEKLQQVAPTVTFTYGNVDYLTQHLEIGKVLNKEQEAQVWIDDFKQRAVQAGDEIKAKIGEEATVSVIETFDKQLYVFGDNWGRGTEILYQEMKLAMPEKVKEMALADGYYALSAEVLADFAGDYLIISKDTESDNSFQNTESYKNIPAVKNNRVFEANAKEFYFNDPITLDYQLEFFIKHFLNK